VGYFVPHNLWFVLLGCHLFTEFLGNVGMLNQILIPPCTHALLGLPAQEALFRWFAVTVIQSVTLLSLSVGTCSRDTTFRLVALSAFIPASPIDG
jgi:hypothetical protein